MSKAREAWAFQEVVASAKLNQANTDWITKGQLVMSTTAGVDDTVDGGATPVQVATTIRLPVWSFNPAKQIADRMRIIGALTWDTSAAGNPIWSVEYTLNSGGAWVNAPLVTALPAAVQPTPPYVGGGAVGPGYTDVDISGIAATHWLSWRIILTGGVAVNNRWIAWALSAYLFNSVDTPH